MIMGGSDATIRSKIGDPILGGFGEVTLFASAPTTRHDYLN